MDDVRLRGRGITRKEFFRLAVVYAAGTALTACTSSINNLITEKPTLNPSDTPRPTITNTPKPDVPTPTSTKKYTLISEDIFTEEQATVINNDDSNKLLGILVAWFGYWTGKDCRNIPFDKYLPDLITSWVFNSNVESEITEAAPVIQAEMADGTVQTFTVPNTDFQRTVPIAPSGIYSIGVGDGPLPISPGDENYNLAVRNGVFIRVDNKNGNISEYVDKESGYWESASFSFTKRVETPFKEEYAAKVGDLSIPIGIALDKDVIERAKKAIKEVHIASDIVDMLGEVWLKVCWLRYSYDTKQYDLTFEKYLDLLLDGEGKPDLAVFDEVTERDSKTPEVTKINQLEGFSLTLVDQVLPVKAYDIPYKWSIFLGRDGRGKILAANQFSDDIVGWYDGLESLKKYGQVVVNSVLVSSIFQWTMILIGNVGNLCFESGNIALRCGPNVYYKPGFDAFFDKIDLEENKFIHGERKEALFTIVR